MDIRDYKSGIANSLDIKTIDNILIKLIVSEKEDDVNCDYYMIECYEDDIREEDFLRALVNMIPHYALKREKLDSLSKENFMKLSKEALRRFVRTENSGEIGELLIFILLEAERKASQLINKMVLKTSGGVHVYGLDGIHIGVLDDDVVLYYCESKTYKDLNKGINAAISDLDKFHQDNIKEAFELELVSDNIDEKKFEGIKDKLLELLDPYTEIDKSHFKKKYAIFIGFDWANIKSFNFRPPIKNIEGKLCKCLKTDSKTICNRCKSLVDKKTINRSVDIFFLPFKDSKKINRDFVREIKS